MARRLAFVCLVMVAAAAPAHAQVYESVGIRAQGMGGAFVGLADDADATWYNPAGLAGAGFVSVITQYGTDQDPGHAYDPDGIVLPSWRSDLRSFAVMVPSLGLSYYRLRLSQIQPFAPATDGTPVSREDRGRVPVRSTSVVLQEFGATVGQSAGNHFVIASTARLIHAGIGGETTAAADASLDRADSLEGSSATHGDLDVGVMAKFNTLRIGVAVKHLFEPAFETATDRVVLTRQARAGMSLSFGNGTARGLGPVVIAADFDLTRTAIATGGVRHVGVGGELWMVKHILGVRGGFTANTVGDARPSTSGGASVRLRTGLFIDGRYTGGADDTMRGWGMALRVAY